MSTQGHGIAAKDCQKLLEAGYATLEAVAYTTKKSLIGVKGITSGSVRNWRCLLTLREYGRNDLLTFADSSQAHSDGIHDRHRVVCYHLSYSRSNDLTLTLPCSSHARRSDMVAITTGCTALDNILGGEP